MEKVFKHFKQKVYTNMAIKRTNTLKKVVVFINPSTEDVFD